MNRTASPLSTGSMGKLLVAAAALTLLAGCGNTKQSLGLTRTAPDEFAVIKRAPLEMPPDYSLRPPSPGAPRPQEQAPSNQAREVVFGREAAQPARNKPNSAEAFLLEQTGGAQADPSIRARVDQERAIVDNSKKPVTERLLGWTRGDSTPPAAVVDPVAEAERLRRNQEEGKPVTAGETPTQDE